MPKDRIQRGARRVRPYKKKTLTYRKRYPTSKTNALAVSTRVNVPRGIFGFPEELKTHLRYVDVYTLTSSSGAVTRQAMRLNSLQDPDSTGTGHQPLYHDQLAAIYKRYSVLGARMTCTFTALPNLTSTAQPSGPVICGVVADDDAATSSTIQTLMESSTAQTDFLCNQMGSNNVKKMSITYSPDRDLGLDADDDTVGAQFGSNPSKVWYGVAFIAESGLSTATSVNVKIEVDYFVKLSQFVDVSQS